MWMVAGAPNATEFSCGVPTLNYSTKLLGGAVSYNSSLGSRSAKLFVSCKPLQAN